MQHQATIVERILERALAYRREVALVVTLAGVVGGSITGYFWYKDRIARHAHKAYSQAVELQNARILKNDETKGVFEIAYTSPAEKWEAVAKAFGDVYKQYPHVGVGVMAGAAQAQAQARLGKFDEARATMGDVLPRITSPQMRSLFTVTYAQLLIDSSSDADVQKGVGLLAQQAANKENAAHDTALYTLGLYYWDKNDFSNARNYWQQLLLAYGNEQAHTSPWVSVAQEKLDLLAADTEQS